MTSEIHAQLLAAAAADPEREMCGLLTGVDRIDAIVPTANVAADPKRKFEIDPVALFAAIRADRAGGAKLLGYYHSHPHGTPTPSAHDHAQATDDGRIWLIIGQARVTAWFSRNVGMLEPAKLSIDPH